MLCRTDSSSDTGARGSDSGARGSVSGACGSDSARISDSGHGNDCARGSHSGGGGGGGGGGSRCTPIP